MVGLGRRERGLNTKKCMTLLLFTSPLFGGWMCVCVCERERERNSMCVRVRACKYPFFEMDTPVAPNCPTPLNRTPDPVRQMPKPFFNKDLTSHINFKQTIKIWHSRHEFLQFETKCWSFRPTLISNTNLYKVLVSHFLKGHFKLGIISTCQKILETKIL